MIIPSFFPLVGGAEKQLSSLAKHLASSGLIIEVVTRSLPLTPKVEYIDGFKVLRLRNYFRNFGFLISLFIHILKNRNTYAVIHIHTLNSPAIVGSFLGHILKIPVLLKVTRSGKGAQLQTFSDGGLKNYLFEQIKQQSYFISITLDVQNELRKLGVDKSRIFSIPNGVEVTQDLLIPLGNFEEKNIIKILYIGRLIKRKRVDLLIKALGALDVNHEFELQVIGDGPERSELETLATSILLKKQFKFTGSLDHSDVLDELQKANVFVLPSDSEGMSNALLEAMASGLAVIAANIPSNRELVKDKENGLLFLTSNELKQNLEVVLSDKELMSMLAINAHQSIYNNFSFERVSNSYLKLYTDLIQETKQQDT